MAKWLSLLSTALIAIIVLGLMTLKLILVHKLSKMLGLMGHFFREIPHRGVPKIDKP